MTFEEKLALLGQKIKSAYDLMGSRWRNSETETIAMQTICACAKNFADHGDAFSWQGNNTLRRGENGLVDNPRGVQILLDDKAIVLEPYDNPKDIPVPSDVVRHADGRPMIFRCTERMLDHAMHLMNLS